MTTRREEPRLCLASSICFVNWNTRKVVCIFVPFGLSVQYWASKCEEVIYDGRLVTFNWKRLGSLTDSGFVCADHLMLEYHSCAGKITLAENLEKDSLSYLFSNWNRTCISLCVFPVTGFVPGWFLPSWFTRLHIFKHKVIHIINSQLRVYQWIAEFWFVGHLTTE